MSVHPADRIRGTSSDLLAGKRIVLGVTGSIAAVETVKLARELLRHGARVQAVMSRDATAIVHPNALAFATGEPVVTELTGRVEHVLAADGEGGADLVLVAPATANTIAKMVHGIDDTPVTTFVSTCLGVKPVAVAPAMHETMHASAVHQANLARLRELGVHLVPPLVEEGKAKMAPVEAVVEHVLRILGPGKLGGRRVLVVAGATAEPVDAMRVLTNRSTGRMGLALAREAFRLGADVTLWLGRGASEPLPFPVTGFERTEELSALAEAGASSFDIVLMPVAVSDYAPVPEAGKIPSGRPGVDLHLKPLPKVIETVRKRCAGTVVAFKAESGVDDAELERRGREAMRRTGADLVVANRLEDVSADATRVLLLSKASTRELAGTKDEVARGILEVAACLRTA